MHKLLVGAALMSSINVFGVTKQDLANLLEVALAEMEMPGVRAAVLTSEGQLTTAAVGLADVEAKISLDDEVAMPGGSTGKTFVAALTMLLVEDGVLNLDDLASQWLAETLWFHRLPNANDIRIRHLLSHSSGIGDYPPTRGYMFGSIWRALTRGSIRFEPEELIGFVLDKSPPFPVGEGYIYTDAGYLVLGRVIEAATGRDYYDLLNERILQPHGLDEVVVQDRSILSGITPGYTRGARNLREDGSMKMDPSSEWTGGGVALNPTMLVRFYSALADGKIVTSSSLDQMIHGGWHDPPSPHEHYGYGMFVYDGGRSFGHAGLWPGYRTDVMHFVKDGITIAVQTNRDGPIDIHELLMRIAARSNIDLNDP